MRRSIELPIHRAILIYLRAVLPAGSLVHHSPNEFDASGPLIARQVAKHKSMGMVVGWPDLEAITAQGVLFFEVKAPGSPVSAAQREVHEALAAMGHRVAVVRSIDDVRAALGGWGIATREVKE